jgi:hypothetical protein
MPDKHTELMRMARGEVKPTNRDERQVAQAARAVYNEVQLARIEVDGAMVLAEHIMNRTLNLDVTRRQLSQDDPLVNLMLAEIEATALRQARAIQNQLYTEW